MPVAVYFVFAGVVGLGTWVRLLSLKTAAMALVTLIVLAVVEAGAS